MSARNWSMRRVDPAGMGTGMSSMKYDPQSNGMPAQHKGFECVNMVPVFHWK